MDRSESEKVKHDDFLGFKLPSDLKAEAKAEAEKRGISLSELARRRLKETTRRDELAAA